MRPLPATSVAGQRTDIALRYWSKCLLFKPLGNFGYQHTSGRLPKTGFSKQIQKQERTASQSWLPAQTQGVRQEFTLWLKPTIGQLVSWSCYERPNCPTFDFFLAQV